MSFHLSGELTNPGLTARDIYFDYWTTHAPYPTVFTSSENGGTASGGDFANGKGHNIISIGNVYNQRDPHRCDDAIASSSAGLDPPNTDREVPTIVTPRSDHNLLYGTSNGTSASTAIAAGIAADLMSENADLKSWPEAMRAILRASASYELSDSNYFSQNLDGKDGGGEVNTYYAYELSYSRANGTAMPYGHDYGTATTWSFTNGLLNQTWQIRKDSNADQHQAQRMRFAIAWDSNNDDFEQYARP